MPNADQRLDDGTLNLLRSGLRIVALRYLDDSEAAEEAVQEVLVRGLAAMEEGRLNNPEALGAYFRGILRHVIADTLRRRSRTISLERLPDLPDENPSSNALHRLVTEEQKAAVAAVIAKLAPQARECLHLIYFQGLHPREVAARLGEPSSRIRKRSSRALQRIRAILLDGNGTGLGHEMGPGNTRPMREWSTEGPGDGDEG